MDSYNIHEAKTHLSRLIQRAVEGKPFVIAKAGKPLVKVARIGAPEGAQIRRLGFLEGDGCIPEDFDRMGEAEIERRFGG